MRWFKVEFLVGVEGSFPMGAMEFLRSAVNDHEATIDDIVITSPVEAPVPIPTSG